MLMLSLKKEESVYITCPCGEVIKVIFCGKKAHNSIKLGFEAKREVDIQREIIYKEKEEANNGQ